jgi:sec-independent protein translocase protein TatC
VGAKLELIDAPLLKHYRRHAIVVNAVLAAALTPTPDVFTMMLMAVPMVLMYEVSIIIARYVNPVSDVAENELATREDEPYDEDEQEVEEVGTTPDEDERDL